MLCRGAANSCAVLVACFMEMLHARAATGQREEFQLALVSGFSPPRTAPPLPHLRAAKEEDAQPGLGSLSEHAF